ncbi:hypothetical protein C8R44DRAFT_877665 [Mycena epipterygia]|nr:hypothetical protein C8R44DRAFT_877662 [Mycena epipterygia]KAJ7120221.1 hypothetical protein C8R44DRAFT_877665 [Mycena epipterygia]
MTVGLCASGRHRAAAPTPLQRYIKPFRATAALCAALEFLLDFWASGDPSFRRAAPPPPARPSTYQHHHAVYQQRMAMPPVFLVQYLGFQGAGIYLTYTSHTLRSRPAHHHYCRTQRRITNFAYVHESRQHPSPQHPRRRAINASPPPPPPPTFLFDFWSPHSYGTRPRHPRHLRRAITATAPAPRHAIPTGVLELPHAIPALPAINAPANLIPSLARHQHIDSSPPLYFDSTSMLQALYLIPRCSRRRAIKVPATNVADISIGVLERGYMSVTASIPPHCWRWRVINAVPYHDSPATTAAVAAARHFYST